MMDVQVSKHEVGNDAYLSSLKLFIAWEVVSELQLYIGFLRTVAKRLKALLALFRGLAHRVRAVPLWRDTETRLGFGHLGSRVLASRGRFFLGVFGFFPGKNSYFSGRGGAARGGLKGSMAPIPIPFRARLIAVMGALVLSPDTALLRLTKMQTSSRWHTSWGIVFYRGFGRLFLLPPLWLLANRKSPRAFMRVARDLGTRRLLGGALLYTIQSVAFIVAANLTYVASVLAILATGPLISAAASHAFLGEKVPRHTWIAAVACAACVAVLFSDSFATAGVDPGEDEVQTSGDVHVPSVKDHLVGNTVALLVPVALASYWTVCKSSPDADMIPALSLSGLGGALLAVAVIFGSSPRREDGARGAAFIPTRPDDDGGVSVSALTAQTFSVAVAFALLTLGAKDVPSAEVSLIMLIELALGPVLVWAAVGEVPTWRVWIGAAGILVTMAVESVAGVLEERKRAPALEDEDPRGASGNASSEMARDER